MLLLMSLLPQIQMQEEMQSYEYFSTPCSSGKTEAILWFPAKVSLKLSKVFIIYQELKHTNDYGVLGSKKAKGYMVEMEI